MKKIALSLIFAACIAQAAEHEVKMLSWGNGEPMVFDPAVLQIAAGDTVTFIPVQPGHQVDSVVVPEGAEKMHSEIDQKYSVTLEKEGIYLYTCVPHRTMNMSGLIQIGKPINRDAVKDAIAVLESKVVMNKGRLSKYLEQLDKMNAEAPKADKANTDKAKVDTKAADKETAEQKTTTPADKAAPAGEHQH